MDLLQWLFCSKSLMNAPTNGGFKKVLAKNRSPIHWIGRLVVYLMTVKGTFNELF